MAFLYKEVKQELESKRLLCTPQSCSSLNRAPEDSPCFQNEGCALSEQVFYQHQPAFQLLL